MDFSKAPKVTEVIYALQNLLSAYGDLPVCADDPDTGWRLRIGVVHKQKNVVEEWPDRFEIKTSHVEMPKGLIGEAEDE